MKIGPSSLPVPFEFLFGLIQRNRIRKTCFLRGYLDEFNSDASGIKTRIKSCLLLCIKVHLFIKDKYALPSVIIGLLPCCVITYVE